MATSRTTAEPRDGRPCATVGSTYEVPNVPTLVLGSGSGGIREQVSLVLELAETLPR